MVLMVKTELTVKMVLMVNDGAPGATGATGASGPTGAVGGNGDVPDEYVATIGDPVRSGGERSFSYNQGEEITQWFVGDTEYNSLAAAQASAAPETTIQIRTLVTQPTRDNISELIDTVTTSYAVNILGVEDTPPLSC